MDSFRFIIIFLFIMILVSIQYTLNKILMELRELKDISRIMKSKERKVQK